MRQEEQDYLRQRYQALVSLLHHYSSFFLLPIRQSALELERLTEQRRHEEEAWHRQQELLQEAERQRRKMMEREEQKLMDQRARCG